MELKKGKSVQLSKNFESTEFDCKCKSYCSTTTIDEQLVTYLQQIRDHFGKSVTINSAYRCKKHNTSVGGASGSKHLYGQAADIKIAGVSPLKLAQYAESIGIKGIGRYSNFVHIDTRKNKYFWNNTNGKNVQTSTFGGQSAFKVEEPKTNKNLEITGATVNIRSGNSANYPKIGTAKKGEKYTCVAVADNGWFAIEMDKDIGWVSKSYAKKI